jgi:hypothetical protein
MDVQFLVNGGVSLLLSPENSMEEELIKQLLKQENDLIGLRSSVIVLGKTCQNGLLICKKNSYQKDKDLVSEKLITDESKT